MYKFSVGRRELPNFPEEHLSHKLKGRGGRRVQASIFLLPALPTLNPCELGKQIKG